MLVALQPSRRRIGAAVLIIITTLIYGALNSALTHETKRQMSEAFLGEPYVSKLKELQGVKCERDEVISEELSKLAEKNSEKMLFARNKMLAINLIILALCAYLSACLIVPRKSSSAAT